MATKTRSSATLPARTSSLDLGRLPGPKSKKHASLFRPPVSRINANGRNTDNHLHYTAPTLNAPIYNRMQTLVQRMLHSEHGVPIKSHKRRLISAIPSAFTGADVVNWLFKNLSLDSKAEATHLANLLCHHGYFFCIEGVGIPVKDDGTLFRFQTPYYWPSQNPDVSDFAYGVYLVKQVLRSKHRIRLLDYELNNLHKLKLRLAKEWKVITEKAEDDVKVFREQKRVAKAIMSSQEEAFWRLYRPPPGESSIQDSALTRHCTERSTREPQAMTKESLQEELEFLKRSSKKTRCKVSTAVESLQNYCSKYKEFDPMMTPPLTGNPWVTGDNTMWTLDKSLIEHPSERQVKKWACSFQDLLMDVTGRFKYEQYCKSQFNLENVKFFQSCQDLKSIPLDAVSGSVQLIYDEFLERGAVSEVNVSADVQGEIEDDLKNPSRYAFSSAKEQIYKLMQNDIYPRFLKSSEYQEMLRKGREVDEAGKGFFAKLQKKKIEFVKQDASGISPCLPQRYTKRQLSISRKLSVTGGSSSLDNIFMASNAPSAGNPFAVETKRNSANTEAFIDSLMDPNKMAQASSLRKRRVSAPDTPVLESSKGITSPLKHSTQASPVKRDNLDSVFGSPPIPEHPVRTPDCGLDTIPMSYSADDMQQLMDDADTIGSSKWKKFGISAGIDFSDGSTLGVDSSSLLRSRSNNPSQADHLAMPLLEISASPRYGRGAFEFESLDQDSNGARLDASSESIHSACSH